jgi:hypothetical protein
MRAPLDQAMALQRPMLDNARIVARDVVKEDRAAV